MPALNAFLMLLIMSNNVEIISFENNWGQHPLFNLVSQSPQGVEIIFSIHEMVVEDMAINGTDMKTYGIPGIFLPNDAGAPNLAGTGRYIAVPEGATARVNIIDFRTEVYRGVKVAPAPVLPLDTDDSPLKYERNMDIYNRNAYYPDTPVRLSDLREIRGVDCVMLGITPFRYNPVTEELIVYKDIRIRIDFLGGTGQFGEDRLRSPHWEQILQGHLLNYASLPSIDFYHRSKNRDNVEYIIIIPDDAVFAAWADTIWCWRQLQGISCEIFTLTDIGGSTTNDIKNFLENAYDTWDPAPVAFLLLSDYPSSGDVYGITSPSFTHPYSGTYVSDNWYADFNGDNLPELHHARICAQTEAQLSLMINKFLDYERSPYTDAGFYDRPIMACAWQTERWFQLCGEVLRGFFITGLGKNPVREYNIYDGTPVVGGAWSTAPNTSTVVNYWYNVGWLPSTTNQNNSTWWNNGTSSAITNAINDGAFLLQHRDHGNELGWGEPAYNTSHLDNLTNTMFTFVYSSNCLTGRYDWSSQCFTEKFHRIDYGALALNAASQVSYSFVNDAYVWGCYDCMWPEFDPGYPAAEMTGYDNLRPCQAMTYGKYYLEASSWPYNTGSKDITYGLFHHHGDCFNILYTEIPSNLTVVHDATLPAGQTTFTVQADDSSVIALTEDYVIIGVVEGTGSSIDIPIPPQDPLDTLVVTVTKVNYYRYEVKVPVVDAGTPDTPTIIRPLDFARLPDDQPTLSFYSDDPQNDDIQYRVLWDTDTDFTSPDSSTTGSYASGATVNFTFPSALTDGETYWWKVKCTDPGGSNYWTPYTVKRSLTIGFDLPASSCSWFQTTAAQFSYNTLYQTAVQGDSVILGVSGVIITDTLLDEDFESGLPVGWTVINGNGDGYEWETGTTGDMGSYPPPYYGSSYAFYSDDDAGNGVINNNEELISPAIGVPPAATSLQFEYGYGFQVYQTGEKYRVKVRTATGSTWNGWDDIAVYTSSTNGTAVVDLTSYLPCDSVQFDWFYSDSTSSSHWGYACACDNVVLTYSYELASDEGSMTGTAVDFDELDATYPRAHWGDVIWHKATGSDSIMLQVEYLDGTWQPVPDSDLPGNASGFFSQTEYDTIDLSGLSTVTYNIIRLSSQFYRIETDAPDDPSLLDWEIGNLSNFLVGTESGQEMLIRAPLFRVFPSVSTHDVHIIFAAGTLNAKTYISIYDAAGRVVRTFYPDPATSHLENRILWHRQDDKGRMVAAGVYFVQYKTEDFTRVNKAILLR
ncbi:MAG: T9SS type A sorting domain-containing protein [candidate division WOR-3 bacterium]|nr:MAG: T9SS type A sorting domain-containing protein [candidate division WOR-3 bacterium]